MHVREWKLSIFIIRYACIFWFYGSYALRQLVTDHINYNKDVYIDHIEGDFSKYVEKISKNGKWSGIVELFAFSNMIDVKESWIRHLQTLYLIEKKINGHSH